MQSKCSNQTKDFLHKLSKKLVENIKANTLIVGDLNVKAMPKSKKVPRFKRRGLNRATQNSGFFGTFVHFPTYKSKRVGKRTIEFDGRNSTKECWVCGRLHDIKVWDQVMRCECGNVIDRDKNSAIILMKRYLSQNAK